MITSVIRLYTAATCTCVGVKPDLFSKQQGRSVVSLFGHCALYFVTGFTAPYLILLLFNKGRAFFGAADWVFTTRVILRPRRGPIG